MDGCKVFGTRFEYFFRDIMLVQELQYSLNNVFYLKLIWS